MRKSIGWTVIGLLAVIGLTACGGGGGGSSTPSSAGQGIVISGHIAEQSGAGMQGVTVSITGAGTATAVTDSQGNYVITGLTNGDYVITPTKAGYTCSPTSRPITINNANAAGQDFIGTDIVGTAILTSITISPANPSIAVGANQQFVATGTYSDNTTQTITSSVIWTSSDQSKAIISNGGLASAASAGTTTIKAVLGSVSGTTILTVTNPAAVLTLIVITPISPPSISVGATQQFTLTGTYSDQTTKDLSSSAVWASSNTDTATVSSTGLATGKAAGSTLIVVTYGGTTVSTYLVVSAVDPLLAYTQILRGRWHFVYTIISTWTDDYSLSTIDPTTNDQGGYWIYGTDQYGDPVNATYWPNDGYWALLDPGITFDQFYTFYTDGTNILSGSCYYQISYPSETWSSCYPLSGYKTSSIPAPSLEKQNGTNIQTVEQLKLENSTSAPIDENTKAKYLQLRDMNRPSLQ